MNPRSYLLCATPRTGSTLLCSLLASTSVAGRPESYFRGPDEAMWAARWNLTPSNPGGIPRMAFFDAALQAGSTENGVFGARIMWGTMSQVVNDLRAAWSDHASSDLQILQRHFGDVEFVYLRRASALEQAISWFRAEQTDFWHDVGTGVARPIAEPTFDFDGIRQRMFEIDADNDAWKQWFCSTGIRPRYIEYEHLTVDPPGVTRALLSNLSIVVPDDCIVNAPNRRLADHITLDWIAKYQAEFGALRAPPS